MLISCSYTYKSADLHLGTQFHVGPGNINSSVGRIAFFNPAYPGSSRPITQTGTKSRSGQLFLVGISLPDCEYYVNLATYVAKNSLTPSSAAEVEDPCSAAKGKWG